MRQLATVAVFFGVLFFIWRSFDFLDAPHGIGRLDVDGQRQSSSKLHADLVEENRQLEQALHSALESAAAVNASKPSPDADHTAVASAEAPDRTSAGVTADSTDNAFAYVFYATTDAYACSALINIHRLRHNLSSTIPIHVLASDEVSEPFLAAFSARNITTHIQVPPPLKEDAVSYYRDCLLKMLAFKMHMLVPGLRRVLALDSDQLIMKNLDHLFTGLPGVDLAAPRAYWLAKDFLASTFLMINLSDRLWETVNSALESIDGNKFDMDLINDLLGDTVMMLSGEYVTLNSHWEDWNLPKWYHMQMTFNLTAAYALNEQLARQNRVSAKRRRNLAPGLSLGPLDHPPAATTPNTIIPLPNGMPAETDSTTTSTTSTESDLPTTAAGPTLPPPSYSDLQPFNRPPPSPRFPPTHPLTQELYLLNDAAAVIHFTAVGKPWKLTSSYVEAIAPDAHPLLAAQGRVWRETAARVCPALQPDKEA